MTDRSIKLNEDDVMLILACLDEGRALMAEASELEELARKKRRQARLFGITGLSKKFEVGKSTIVSISRGRTWRHVISRYDTQKAAEAQA